jgi:hypothetical protein
MSQTFQQILELIEPGEVKISTLRENNDKKASVEARSCR